MACTSIWPVSIDGRRGLDSIVQFCGGEMGMRPSRCWADALMALDGLWMMVWS